MSSSPSLSATGLTSRQPEPGCCLQACIKNRTVLITTLGLASLGIIAMVVLAVPSVHIVRPWEISLGVSLGLVAIIIGGAICLRRISAAPSTKPTSTKPTAAAPPKVSVSDEFGKRLVGIGVNNLSEMGIAARKWLKIDLVAHSAFNLWVIGIVGLDSQKRTLTNEEWFTKLKTNIDKASNLRDYVPLLVIQRLANRIAEGLEKYSGDPLNFLYACFIGLDDDHLGGIIYFFNKESEPGLKALYEQAQRSVSFSHTYPNTYYAEMGIEMKGRFINHSIWKGHDNILALGYLILGMQKGGALPSDPDNLIDAEVDAFEKAGAKPVYESVNHGWKILDNGNDLPSRVRALGANIMMMPDGKFGEVLNYILHRWTSVVGCASMADREITQHAMKFKLVDALRGN